MKYEAFVYDTMSEQSTSENVINGTNCEIKNRKGSHTAAESYEAQ
jgi:hypothetical protein